jgi:replication-associated recombination protein RarA
VAQDKAIAKIKSIARGGYGGHVFWISGKSGTGKTTIARLIAAELATAMSTIEVESGETLTIGELRAHEDIFWHGRTIGGGKGCALIVNEAHGIKSSVVRYMLTMLERQPDYAVVVFTTTSAGDELFEEHVDAGAFRSRVHEIGLAQRDLCEPFARRAYEIAQAENRNGMPIETYIAAVKERGNNLRAVLQWVEER